MFVDWAGMVHLIDSGAVKGFYREGKFMASCRLGVISHNKQTGQVYPTRATHLTTD